MGIFVPQKPTKIPTRNEKKEKNDSFTQKRNGIHEASRVAPGRSQRGHLGHNPNALVRFDGQRRSPHTRRRSAMEFCISLRRRTEGSAGEGTEKRSARTALGEGRRYGDRRSSPSPPIRQRDAPRTHVQGQLQSLPLGVPACQSTQVPARLSRALSRGNVP